MHGQVRLEIRETAAAVSDTGRPVRSGEKLVAEAWARVNPLSSQVDMALYGPRAQDMLSLILPPDAPIRVNHRVYLDGDGAPWICVSVERWPACAAAKVKRSGVSGK